MTASLSCSSVKHTVYFLFCFGIICRLVGFFFVTVQFFNFVWLNVKYMRPFVLG